MDCKRDIYAMLFRMNFRMSGDIDKLQMKLMTRLRIQEWVLPEQTNTKLRSG